MKNKYTEQKFRRDVIKALRETGDVAFAVESRSTANAIPDVYTSAAGGVWLELKVTDGNSTTAQFRPGQLQMIYNICKRSGRPNAAAVLIYVRGDKVVGNGKDVIHLFTIGREGDALKLETAASFRQPLNGPTPLWFLAPIAELTRHTEGRVK